MAKRPLTEAQLNQFFRWVSMMLSTAPKTSSSQNLGRTAVRLRKLTRDLADRVTAARPPLGGA